MVKGGTLVRVGGGTPLRVSPGISAGSKEVRFGGIEGGSSGGLFTNSHSFLRFKPQALTGSQISISSTEGAPRFGATRVTRFEGRVPLKPIRLPTSSDERSGVSSGKARLEGLRMIPPPNRFQPERPVSEREFIKNLGKFRPATTSLVREGLASTENIRNSVVLSTTLPSPDRSIKSRQVLPPQRPEFDKKFATRTINELALQERAAGNKDLSRIITQHRNEIFRATDISSLTSSSSVVHEANRFADTISNKSQTHAEQKRIAITLELAEIEEKVSELKLPRAHIVPLYIPDVSESAVVSIPTNQEAPVQATRRQIWGSSRHEARMYFDELEQLRRKREENKNKESLRQQLLDRVEVLQGKLTQPSVNNHVETASVQQLKVKPLEIAKNNSRLGTMLDAKPRHEQPTKNKKNNVLQRITKKVKLVFRVDERAQEARRRTAFRAINEHANKDGTLEGVYVASAVGSEKGTDLISEIVKTLGFLGSEKFVDGSLTKLQKTLAGVRGTKKYIKGLVERQNEADPPVKIGKNSSSRIVGQREVTTVLNRSAYDLAA